jgi:hypothetical protein
MDIKPENIMFDTQGANGVLKVRCSTVCPVRNPDVLAELAPAPAAPVKATVCCFLQTSSMRFGHISPVSRSTINNAAAS